MVPPNSDEAGLYARSFVDVYDEWYGDGGDLSPFVSAIRSAVEPGSLLVELGSGSGRLASPLVDAGYRVVAVDISARFLAADQSGSARIRADMSVLPLATNSVACVIVGWNTLFNLTSPAAQESCFREMARVLISGGQAVVDALVTTGLTTGISMRAHPSDDGLLAIATAATDPTETRIEGAAALLDGVHIELRDDGLRLRPWRLRAMSPTAMDAMSAVYGLSLAERSGSWGGEDPVESRAISWYRKT